MEDADILVTLNRIEKTQKEFIEGMAEQIALLHARIQVMDLAVLLLAYGNRDPEEVGVESATRLNKYRDDILPVVRESLGLS